MLLRERSFFLPCTVWTKGEDGWQTVTRESDPDQWQALAHADDPVVTMIDTPDGAVTPLPVSSSSAPSVVESVLAEADPQPGERILEIGTGTGYMAYRLAATPGTVVTSVDVLDECVQHARTQLLRAGSPAYVTCADGQGGYSAHAPYDLIVATCAVSHIPPAWDDQLADDGRVVAPLKLPYSQLGVMRAQRNENAVLIARLCEPEVQFMPLTAHRSYFGSTHLWDAPDDEWEHSSTHIDGYTLLYDRSAATFLALSFYDVHCHAVPDDDGSGGVIWFIDTVTGSVATHTTRAGSQVHEIRQRGPRRLFNEITRVYDMWLSWSEPSWQRMNISWDLDVPHPVYV